MVVVEEGSDNGRYAVIMMEVEEGSDNGRGRQG
jgi:hypothetical protein